MQTGYKIMSEEDISVEEVERALREIDNKYSPTIKKHQEKYGNNQMLCMLTKELDSLGLPVIEFCENSEKLLEQVISCALSLVHLHRKTLGKLQDTDITCQSKDLKYAELLKKNESYKKQLMKLEEKQRSLEVTILKSKSEIIHLQKKEICHKDEMERLKKFCFSKENEFSHTVNKLVKENEHLKQIFGKDIGNYISRDDITVDILNKHKKNEEVYKKTIQKLQQNNTELISEVLNLKEELYNAQSADDHYQDD